MNFEINAKEWNGKLNEMKIGTMIARLKVSKRQHLHLVVGGHEDERWLDIIRYELGDDENFYEAGYLDKLHEMPKSVQEVEELLNYWSDDEDVLELCEQNWSGEISEEKEEDVREEMLGDIFYHDGEVVSVTHLDEDDNTVIVATSSEEYYPVRVSELVKVEEAEQGLKTFDIPVTWQMAGDMKVKARTLDEAIKKAHDAPLPKGSYVDDSFEVITEFIDDK